MTTIELLEQQYNHAFNMVKFGETKNGALIAFNGAIITGMTILAFKIHNIYLFYFLFLVFSMCGISILICLSALIAKIKQSTNNTSLILNDNPLFFATLATMTHEELIYKIKNQYQCESSNPDHENDLARQVIITSQIAARKFRLFNLALAFTFSGILTPLCLIFYKIYLGPAGNKTN